VKVIYLAAILTGVATTMLGPLMPGFEARWNLDDAQGGLLFVAQFIASVAAATSVGVLAKRLGYWGVIAAGLAVAAAGVAGCAAHSWTLATISVAVYGCGLGVVVPAANLGVAAAAKGDSARPVLWLNLFWSIGAVTAPILVALLKSAFLPSLAAGFLAMGLWVALGGAGHRPTRMEGGAHSGGLPHFVFALMLFLYVGSEASIAGWVSSFATRSIDTQRLWAVLPSVFWGAILAGRLIAPAILHRIKPAALAPWSLACAFGGALLLLAGSGPAAMLAGSAISGLGLSPIFPVVVASYADRMGGGSLSGLVFAAAGLGGATIPPLVGLVSTASGSLRMGLATVLALMAAMLFLIRTAMPSRYSTSPTISSST
jgi:FHS family glucose/mannose:H+ symporter-like MFS transporter